MLILPLLGAAIVGLLMVYTVGGPVALVLASRTAWLQSMQTSSAVVLGLILGAMMAFDMGGPVNKSAYAFSVGLLANQAYTPMAAVMAAEQQTTDRKRRVIRRKRTGVAGLTRAIGAAHGRREGQIGVIQCGRSPGPFLPAGFPEIMGTYA